MFHLCSGLCLLCTVWANLQRQEKCAKVSMYHVIKQSTVKTLSCGQTKKYWTKPSHKPMCPLTKSLHESTNDCVYLQHFYIIKKNTNQSECTREGLFVSSKSGKSFTKTQIVDSNVLKKIHPFFNSSRQIFLLKYRLKTYKLRIHFWVKK